MHLTDSAVHQQLFLDVLNGTKVLVGTISSSISAAPCHRRFFLDAVKFLSVPACDYCNSNSWGISL